jgi:hypothetical protein
VSKDPECEKLCIPERLHRVGRPVVREFEDTELLFRRYDPDQITDLGLADAAITFRNDGMSVNRSKFSDFPEDVLYKTTESGRHDGHKYLTFRLVRLTEFSWEHPVSKQKYSVEIEHDPKRCMYPHTLVKLLQERRIVERVKSPANRLELKEKFITFCSA